MAGVRLDRYRWDKIQIGSGAPVAGTRGNIYLNSDNANLYVRKDAASSWTLNASEGYGTLNDAYNDYGASPATVVVDNAEGQGDVTWDITGALSFVIDLANITGSADGFSVINGTDNFNLIRDNTNLISLDADLSTADIATSSNLILNSGGDIRFTDLNRAASVWTQTYIPLSDSADDWDNFEIAFGEVSLLNALSVVGIDSSGWGGNLKTSNTTTQVAFDEIDRQYYTQEWTGAFGNTSKQIFTNDRGSAQDVFSVSVYGYMLSSSSSEEIPLTPDGTTSTKLVLDTNGVYFVEGMILCTYRSDSFSDPEDLYGYQYVKSWKVKYTVVNDYGYIRLIGFDKEVVHVSQDDSLLDKLDIVWEADQTSKSLNLIAKRDSGGSSSKYIVFQGGLRAQKINTENLPYNPPV